MVDVGRVSVVLATYNMAQYLAEAVSSVLGQSYGNLELHVIDDGSTDSTAEVASRFEADPRFHYHRQENAGQTRAKNAGIALSTGDFIAFCDADDKWTPDKLEVQLPLFDAGGNVGVVYGRKQQISPDGAVLPSSGPLEPHYRGNVTEELFKLNFIPFGTAIVRRECIEKLGPFDERHRMGIDWELWLRLSTQYQFDYVEAVVYLYRVWPGQMSHNWKGRYDHAFAIMNDFLAANGSLVSPRTVRDAYAHSYYSRGRLRALNSGQYVEGLKDVLRAIRIRPFYFHAWKMLARIGLVAAGGKAKPGA